MKTKSSQHILRLVSYLSLLCLCLKILPIEINATSTFYNNNELWLIGKLVYVGSSWGNPSDNLNGETHKLFFNAESERCLLKDPYLSNASSNILIGYIDNNMSFKIPFGGRLEVNQEHYNYDKTKNATAYYDVVVNDIQTNLLYRPERNDKYITFISIGLILFGFVTIIKVVRHD